MLSININNIKIENNFTIMTVILKNNERENKITDVQFLLNDFDETTKATTIKQVNINDYEISYTIKFELTNRFNQFNDGILKIDIQKQDDTIRLFMVIYSLDSWDLFEDEEEKVLAYFEDIDDFKDVETEYSFEHDNDIKNIENSVADEVELIDIDFDDYYEQNELTYNENTSNLNSSKSYYNIKDLNGYNDFWINIKLTSWNLDFTSNSDNLFAEFVLTYKSNFGNVLNDLEFYITTNSGSQYKPTGYLTRDGAVPNKIDIWFDNIEHTLKIGPTFSIKHSDSIIEDGLRLTMTFKDTKQSYFVRKTYVLDNRIWYHEELFAIPLKNFTY